MPQIMPTNKRKLSFFGKSKKDKISKTQFRQRGFFSKYQDRHLNISKLQSQGYGSSSSFNNLNRVRATSVKSRLEKEKRDKIIQKRNQVGMISKISHKLKRNPGNNYFEKPIKSTRKKRKFFNKTTFLIILIPVLLALIVLAALQTQLFDVNEIKIEGYKNINSVELKNYIRKNGGTGLIFNISPARLKRNIEQEFGFVKSATVSKDLPSTLKVTIEEYEPRALLETHSNSYLVSTTGVILFENVDTKALKETYPLLTIDSDNSYKLKDIFDSNILNAGLDTLQLAKSQAVVNSIVIKTYPDKSADASIIFGDGTTWIMTLTKKSIMEQYTILQGARTLKNFKIIDTRFAGSYIIK